MYEVVEFTRRGPVNRYEGDDPIEARAIYDTLDNAAIFVMRDGRQFRSAMKFRGVETAAALKVTTIAASSGRREYSHESNSFERRSAFACQRCVPVDRWSRW
jgi:hypothetical protein